MALGASLFVCIVVALVISKGLFDVLQSRTAKRDLPPSPMAVIEQLPPEPRLLANPSEELRRMRAEEEMALHSYGWVDRSQGIVRIPIERAMALIHDKGIEYATAERAKLKKPGEAMEANPSK